MTRCVTWPRRLAGSQTQQWASDEDPRGTTQPSPDAQPNLHPIYDGPLKLARTVPNGKAYIAGNGEYSFWLLHLWGTPYQVRGVRVPRPLARGVIAAPAPCRPMRRWDTRMGR